MTNAGSKYEVGDPCESQGSKVLLSPPEQAVLNIFRKYLMTPKKMLCLSKADVETHGASLTKLTNKGLLVAESFQGGYSLTETGFAVMKETG